MMVKKIVMCLVIGMFGLAVFAQAVSAGATPEEAKAMVEKAETYFMANGKDKSLKEFTNQQGEFVKGELYVFAWDLNGTSIAHVNPKQIGINLVEIPDVDGKYFRKEGLEQVKKNGTAWVDYKFKNPKSGKVEQKTSYLKKVGDIIIGCGAYK